jgi:hypothetical protein
MLEKNKTSSKENSSVFIQKIPMRQRGLKRVLLALLWLFCNTRVATAANNVKIDDCVNNNTQGRPFYLVQNQHFAFKLYKKFQGQNAGTITWLRKKPSGSKVTTWTCDHVNGFDNARDKTGLIVDAGKGVFTQYWYGPNTGNAGSTTVDLYGANDNSSLNISHTKTLNSIDISIQRVASDTQGLDKIGVSVDTHIVVLDGYKGLGFYQVWHAKPNTTNKIRGSHIYFRGVNCYKGDQPLLCSGNFLNTGTSYQDPTAHSWPVRYKKDADGDACRKNSLLGTICKNPQATTEPYLLYESENNYSGDEEIHYGHGYWGGKLQDGQGQMPWDWYWLIPGTAKKTMTGGPFKQNLRGLRLEIMSESYITDNKAIKNPHSGWPSTISNANQYKWVGPFFEAFADPVKTDPVKTEQAAKKKIVQLWKAVNGEPNRKGIAAQVQDIAHATSQGTYIIDDKAASSSTGNLIVGLTLPALRKGNKDKQAIYILSDNKRPSALSSGYQRWGFPNAQGKLTFAQVLPGTYRLTAYVRGHWGTYIQDNVEVKANQTTTTTGKFAARFFGDVKKVFGVGIPDLSPMEFKFARYPDTSPYKRKPARQYPWYMSDYLNGPFNFDFTSATPPQAKNIPFTYWRKWQANDSSTPKWAFQFKVTREDLQNTNTVVFSMHLASTYYSTLTFELNDASEQRAWRPSMGDCDNQRRSGMGGCPQQAVIVWPKKKLKDGDGINTLSVYVTGNLDTGKHKSILDQGQKTFQLDALKLELSKKDIASFTKPSKERTGSSSSSDVLDNPHMWRDVDIVKSHRDNEQINATVYGDGT